MVSILFIHDLSDNSLLVQSYHPMTCEMIYPTCRCYLFAHHPRAWKRR